MPTALIRGHPTEDFDVDYIEVALKCDFFPLRRRFIGKVKKDGKGRGKNQRRFRYRIPAEASGICREVTAGAVDEGTVTRLEEEVLTMPFVTVMRVYEDDATSGPARRAEHDRSDTSDTETANTAWYIRSATPPDDGYPNDPDQGCLPLLVYKATEPELSYDGGGQSSWSCTFESSETFVKN